MSTTADVWQAVRLISAGLSRGPPAPTVRPESSLSTLARRGSLSFPHILARGLQPRSSPSALHPFSKRPRTIRPREYLANSLAHPSPSQKNIPESS